MEDIFSYKDVQQGTPSSSTQQPVPSTSGHLPMDPQAFLTTPDIGSGLETIGARGPRLPLPNPYAAGARAIRPGSDQKRWSHTGLAKEFNLKFEDDLYHCPFPRCDYTPRQNINSVCTHIHQHLNISLQCHYCTKLYWGLEGWLKHTREVHKNTPPVPDTYGHERPPSPQDIVKEAMDTYEIATQEENEALKGAGKHPLPDFSIEPKFKEVEVTEESEVQPEAQETGAESEDVIEVGSD